MSEMITDGGRIVKMEVDYSSACDEKIPQCEELAKNEKLTEALEILFSLEKQTRTGADAHSTSRVLVTIVKLCYGAKDWNKLMENVILLTKRRSQIKMAVTKMIQECCGYLDETPDKATLLKMIDTLITVTAGKIYVEKERARLTHRLAKIKESDGDIIEAATVLQELQVETFGSMEKKEKVELILEQMRLCLATKDYIRTQIISKKINIKFFDEEGSEDLKLKYYQLMIDLDSHDKTYLAVCKHYRAIFNTPCIQNDENKRKEALKCVVLYLVLSTFNNEQSDLTHRVKGEKRLEEIPKYRDLLLLFITPELINWNALCENYEEELKNSTSATDVFNSTTENGKKHWEELKNRTVEHNIRIMAKYYTRISIKRMAELLNLSIEETEEFLSSLVVSKMVHAKTDRLVGVVDFSLHKKPNEVLNDWSHNIKSLMQLVNKTTHLINKEEMIHKHLHLKKV